MVCWEAMTTGLLNLLALRPGLLGSQYGRGGGPWRSDRISLLIQALLLTLLFLPVPGGAHLGGFPASPASQPGVNIPEMGGAFRVGGVPSRCCLRLPPVLQAVGLL